MANDGSTRAADKKREKTLGIKAFSPPGVIRTAQTSRPNALPGGNQAVRQAKL
jgi:hypothetical protein